MATGVASGSESRNCYGYGSVAEPQLAAKHTACVMGARKTQTSKHIVPYGVPIWWRHQHAQASNLRYC